jgi:hypothetical protein
MEIVNPFVSDNKLINATCNTLEYIFCGNQSLEIISGKIYVNAEVKIYFSHCTFPSCSY